MNFAIFLFIKIKHLTVIYIEKNSLILFFITYLKIIKIIDKNIDSLI